jgi:AcrR family transcriptional regulator
MKISPDPAKKSPKQKQNGDKQPYHHGDLRAALLKAALLLIDRHGVKGFSLKDAAALAGVSTAAPYRHFADKAALLYALQGEGFALFNASLAAAFARGETASSKIVEMGVAYVRFAMQHPAHFRVMFGLTGGSEAGNSPEPDPSRASGFLLLVEAVTAFLPRVEPAVRNDLVIAAWSLVHGFAWLQIESAFEGTVAMGDVESQLRRTITLTLQQAGAGQSMDSPGNT